MNGAEIAALVIDMMRKWPHAGQRLAGEEVAADYADHLEQVAAEHARAAVESWARDGERWPPSAGEILQRLADLILDPPDWGTVKAHLVGHAPVPAGAPQLPDACPYDECEGDGIVIVDWARADSRPCRCRPERQAIQRQRRGRHPLVAAFLQHVGTLEIADLQEDRTAEAQIREKWLSFLRDVRREVAYHGLDPAGLPRLERITKAPTLRGELGAASGPHQLGPAAIERVLGGAA
jgi:hypothetical protein